LQPAKKNWPLPAKNSLFARTLNLPGCLKTKVVDN
jgi:hypothetical protein